MTAMNPCFECIGKMSLNERECLTRVLSLSRVCGVCGISNDKCIDTQNKDCGQCKIWKEHYGITEGVKK